MPHDLKKLRDQRGWSQKQLADELGVDQATVSRIECGRTEPSPTVRRLLDRIVADTLPTEQAA